MAGRKVTYIIDVDEKGAVKGAQRVERALDQAGDEAKQADRQISRVGGGMKAMGAMAAGAGAAVVAGMGLALVKGVQLAETVEETASKYRTTLGPAVDKANQFIERYAQLMGLSVTEARELMATNTNIAKSFGLQTDEAADLSIQLLKTAGDLSSFNNVPIEQSTHAITAALVGEREALKTLGIVITEEMVQKQAMIQFSLDSADAVTMEMKALATMTLVRDKAGVAMGDLMRTQDSASNQRKQVQAGIKNLAETLSMGLMPAYTDTLGIVGEIVDELNDWLGINLSDKMIKEQTKLNVLVRELANHNTEEKRRNELITQITKNYPDFLEKIDLEKASSEDLLGVLKEVNKAYRERIARQIASENISEAVKERVEAHRELIQIKNESRQALQGADNLIDRSGFSQLEPLEMLREAYEQLGGAKTAALAQTSSIPIDQLGPAVQANMRVHKLLQKLTEAKGEVKQAIQNENAVRKEELSMLDSLGISLETQADRVAQFGDSLGSVTKKELQNMREEFGRIRKAFDEGSDNYEYYTNLIGEVDKAIEALNDTTGEAEKGYKTLSGKLKGLKEEYQTIIDQTGPMTEAQRERGVQIQAAIDKTEQLIQKKKDLTVIPLAPIVPPQKPQDEVIKAGAIAGPPGINIGGYIFDKQTAQEAISQKNLTELYGVQSQLRMNLRNAETEQYRQIVAQRLQLVNSEIAMQQQLVSVFRQSMMMRIQSGEQLLEHIISATKHAIKAKIAAAVAEQVGKALATIPFPFNIAAAAAAGGAVSLLFEKVIPDFERGGVANHAQAGMVAQGPSHAEGGMLAMIGGKPAFEFERGEAIISKKATQMFLPELSAINQAGGGVPLAREGALTLNAIPRDMLLPAASVNSGAIESGVERGIERGLAKANITARAEFQEFHRDYEDFKKQQNRIGN